MREFMACQGQIVLANYLNGVVNRKPRGPIDLDLELELLKCLKRSISAKVCFYRML
jgi:cytokinesis protein